MKLKKIIIFLVCPLLSVPVTFAGQITKDRAETVAKNAYAERVQLDGIKISADAINIVSTIADYNGSKVNFFIMNIEDGGFIIISGDDNVTPILGYSFENNFNKSDLPPQLSALLEEYRKELAIDVLGKSVTPSNEIIEEWAKYESSGAKSGSIKAVSPLLSCNWSQNCGYNTYCPDDNNGPCGKVYVGCVAVAMGQVMYYHQYPTMGNGSHSYTHWTYGTLSADFENTTYNWSEMEDNSGNTASALLLYHCGVSVDMDYSSSGSGIPYNSLYKVTEAFSNYFNYNDDATLLYRSNYESSTWEEMVRAEIDANRPLFYAGTSSVGHAFNIDGYQGTNYFHVNWGWSGYYNGYFYLSSLSAGGYDFSNNQVAAFYVEKGSYPNDLTISNGISSGTHRFSANNTITSNSAISGSADVTMSAGTQIRLISGFKANAGTRFNAKLNGVSATKDAEVPGKAIFGTETEVSDLFKIYPNPSYGTLNLKLANDNSLKIISVYSLQGTLIKRLETTDSNVGLDLENLNQGIYNICVKINGNILSKKLILK